MLGVKAARGQLSRTQDSANAASSSPQSPRRNLGRTSHNEGQRIAALADVEHMIERLPDGTVALSGLAG